MQANKLNSRDFLFTTFHFDDKDIVLADASKDDLLRVIRFMLEEWRAVAKIGQHDVERRKDAWR